MDQHSTIQITIPYSHFTPESFAYARSEFVTFHNEPVTHVHISSNVWDTALLSEKFIHLIDLEDEYAEVKEGLVGTLFGPKVIVDMTLTDYQIRLFNEDKNILASCVFAETFLYIIHESTGEKHAIIAIDDVSAIQKAKVDLDVDSFINLEKICSFNQIKH